MAEALRRRGLVAAVLFAVVILAGVALGCGESDADEEITTTAAKSTDSTLEFTTEESTVIVDGPSSEEWEARLPDLEAAVEATPTDLNALQELALAQYNTQRYEEAVASYEKMLALKDDAFTRNNYANVLRDWGKTEDAKAQYEKAITSDPSLVTPYINLAAVLARQGKTADALAVLDRGLQVATGDDKVRLESYKEQLTTPSTT